MSTNRLSNNNMERSTPTHTDVDQNELNNIIDALLEVRQNIRADAPEFGIKPVNLSEKQIEFLIEKSQ